MPDPSYAHPAALRVALAFGVAAAMLAAARLSGPRAAASAVWLWLAVLGVAVAAFLPGFSPYFLLPVGVAAVLLLASARFGWGSGVGQGALALAAIAALAMWLQLTASGETLMGLKLHPLFTIPAAIAVATLVPLLATDRLPARIWKYSVGGCFAAGLIAAVVAGLQPAYSEIAPQRLNILYSVDNKNGEAHWLAETDAPLPASLRNAGAKFSDTARLVYPWSWRAAYVAPAPRAQIEMPGAAILTDTRRPGGREITLGLDGSSDAAAMMLVVPGAVKLRRVVIGQKIVDIPAAWARQKFVTISCMSSDCTAMPVTLQMADTGAVQLQIVERIAGLPDSGEKLAAARGARAVPSQFGDSTMLVAPRTVPPPQ